MRQHECKGKWMGLERELSEASRWPLVVQLVGNDAASLVTMCSAKKHGQRGGYDTIPAVGNFHRAREWGQLRRKLRKSPTVLAARVRQPVSEFAVVFLSDHQMRLTG